MFLTAICLSIIGLFIKLIDNNVHYMTVNFLRIFIGFLFLLIIVPKIDKNTFKLKKSDLKSYAFIGFLFAVSLSLYTTSLFFTNIQSAVMINYSYPIYMLFFGYIILGEKINNIKIITLILALIGLFIINPISDIGNMTGNLLAVGGSICYALLIVFMRKEDKNHSIGSVVWFLGFASLFTLPFAISFGFDGIGKSIYYILGLGILSTGLAYLLYNLSLEEIEAEIAGVIAMIITPLVSIILAYTIINEQLNIRTITGGIFLVIAGLYLNLGEKLSILIKNKLKIILSKTFKKNKYIKGA